MTTDPLLAEIKKCYFPSKSDWGDGYNEAVKQIIKLVVADRARQQAEKEKMIAELKAKRKEIALSLPDEYDDGKIYGIDYAIEIIQGKEEELSK